MWFLEYKDTEQLQRYKLKNGTCTIGRTGCVINLDDAKVSRHHCTVFLHDGHVLIVDNSSSNGTYVNGKKVDKCDLKHLDTIAVGMTFIKVLNI